MKNTTEKVKDYWNESSCGTGHTGEDKHSLAYFEEIEEFRYRHEPFIHSFAQFTRWRDKKILEVGVGAGSDFLQFVRASADAYGVDLTEEAIENVRHRLSLYGLSASEVRVCNAEDLPYEDGAFDLVYSWGVIHHADDTEKVLAEIYRVTRPGGVVKIMVYNLNSLFAWYRFFRHGFIRGRWLGGRRWAVYRFQESYATKIFSERELRNIISTHPHHGLRFRYDEQYIRKGAKFEIFRKFLQRMTPERMRWFISFEFCKPEMDEDIPTTTVLPAGHSASAGRQ